MLLLLFAGLWPADPEMSGQEVRIEQYGFTPDGHFEIIAPGDVTAYYRLLQGHAIDQIDQVVGLSLGGVMVARSPVPQAQAFFRLEKIQRAQSLDADQDGLSDVLELLAGTDPFDPDSDNDGWSDEAEVTAGSDPNDPRSQPSLPMIAAPRTDLIVPTAPGIDATQHGLVLAAPRFEAILPAATGLDAAQYGLVVAAPRFEAVLPAAPRIESADYSLILANPRMELVLPGTGASLDSSLGLVVAQPSVVLTIPIAPDPISEGLELAPARPIAEAANSPGGSP